MENIIEALHSVVSGWADYLPFSGKCLTSTDAGSACSMQSVLRVHTTQSWILAEA